MLTSVYYTVYNIDPGVCVCVCVFQYSKMCIYLLNVLKGNVWD